jgi:hypothetical protein
MPLTRNWLAISFASAMSRTIWSSVTSRMRPGHCSDFGRLGDERGDLHPEQDADRHVDGEVQVESRLIEHRPIAQRRKERMLGEFGNALIVDIRQETAGKQNAELRMVNARERFRTGKAFALQIDLGLVPDLKPVIAQRIGDRDLRPLAGGHGIDESAALVLGHMLDRPGPASHVL